MCSSDLSLGVFSTGPQIKSTPWNLMTEIIGTFVLVFVIITFGQTPSGLGPLAVALLVVGIGASLGGPTGYAINPARDLGPRTAHALLRCVQEGVTNSVRHAGARRVQVELRGDGEEVAVSIDDDGRGAPHWHAGRAGNGLSGMAERMTELGGQMRVTRTSPGFRIELRCPRWV